MYCYKKIVWGTSTHIFATWQGWHCSTVTSSIHLPPSWPSWPCKPSRRAEYDGLGQQSTVKGASQGDGTAYHENLGYIVCPVLWLLDLCVVGWTALCVLFCNELIRIEPGGDMCHGSTFRNRLSSGPCNLVCPKARLYPFDAAPHPLPDTKLCNLPWNPHIFVME